MDLNKKPWPLTTVCGIKDRIDSNPDFQRPPVWKTAQKQMLIDTILRGLDIPKLYWRRTGKNPDKYDVIDGQQRLRSIWEFKDGLFKTVKDADDIEGVAVANLRYDELPDDLRIRFDTYSLDVVVLTDAGEDEVRDMFLRLQNGTPLKAQEKRNAMSGKMRDFVKDIAQHPFFTSVNFRNSRFVHDLVAAQIIQLELAGGPCDIRNGDLNDLYQNNAAFDTSGVKAKKVRRVLDYLHRAFPTKTPELERYNVISLYLLVSSFIDRFDMAGKETQLASWFIAFEGDRAADEVKTDNERTPELITYHDLISHSTDAEPSISKRNETLGRRFLLAIPGLRLRDNQRDFTHEQRIAIFRRDGGKCQVRLKCAGAECTWDNWHADHKVPWVRAGPTTVENSQLACPACNTAKNDKLEPMAAKA